MLKTKSFCVKSQPGEFHPGSRMNQSPINALTGTEVKTKEPQIWYWLPILDTLFKRDTEKRKPL